MYYIPSRFSEGYGLNNGAADRIFDEGAELIITVDCGCVSAAEVDHIKELGMEVIVTDHHNVDSRKPDCILLDPKQEGDDYPCSWLCGCGVAFKLAQALQRRMGLPKSSVNRLLDLACVATIGDIVPLTGENRTLVKYGFDRIARGEREGLKRLIEGIGLDRYHLSSMNVAFGIVPHLNAAGRMKDASIGVRLLTGREEDQLNDLVEELKSLNSERKSIQERIFREACDEIRGCMQEDLFPVYDAKDAHEGVTGIVAGKLKETFYRPVIIVTDTEEPGYVKGTGRSVEGLDLHGILSGCADLFCEIRRSCRRLRLYDEKRVSGKAPLFSEPEHAGLPGKKSFAADERNGVGRADLLRGCDAKIRIADRSDGAFRRRQSGAGVSDSRCSDPQNFQDGKGRTVPEIRLRRKRRNDIRCGVVRCG